MTAGLRTIGPFRVPNEDLVKLLEDALERARSGEIVAGVGCFVGDTNADGFHRWNVVSTHAEAMVAVGLMQCEIADVVERANRGREDGGTG